MVFRIAVGRSKPKGSIDAQKHSPGRNKKHEKKSQLLHPISPYDELPEIQDLVEKLGPLETPQAPKPQRIVQERQQRAYNHHRSSNEYQQRDPPLPSTTDLYLNGAHDVPLVIEIPSIPMKHSEDSEMTVEDIFRPKTNDDRGPRSLTPHPSFEEEIKRSASDLKFLFEVGTEAEREVWPSDEESIADANRKMDGMAWPDGSMLVWNLDCSDENAIEFRCSDRRMMEV